MSLLDRLQSPGSKRILALDGGGIRGALTVGFLKRIEHVLRERHGRPDMALADYFDLIGGTSTGAIIATALAIGMTSDQVENYFFSRGSWRKSAAITGEYCLSCAEFVPTSSCDPAQSTLSRAQLGG
jgi:predicted acylesterase/phospholipase RssA